MLNANDIELLEKANRYKLNNTVKKRVKKLVEQSSDEDKIDVALNYAHSITKSEVRGTK